MNNVMKTFSFSDAISPMREMAAYEALWSEKGATFKTIADKFRGHDILPSALVLDEQAIESAAHDLLKMFAQLHVSPPGIRVNGSMDYPSKLRDAKNPVEVLYYKGNWDLAFSPAIAIVGARKASEDGTRRASKLARMLVGDGFTVVSGLASGIDRAAHESAIRSGGRTIAVIGTPLTERYPKENADLQDLIEREHLIISQVPFLHHSRITDYRIKSRFFPERNVTMSALTQATVIVEASDTSGTLYQARAAIAQGRKLFIMDNCFKRSDLKWPNEYLKKGAIRVSDYKDIVQYLEIPRTDND
jgi:DNA processing protein